jgi:hypothetical protein
LTVAVPVNYLVAKSLTPATDTIAYASGTNPDTGSLDRVLRR